MATTFELSEAHRIALEHDTTEVTTDELQGLIKKRNEEWKKTAAGQEIIKLLESKKKQEAQIAQAATNSRQQLPQATDTNKSGAYVEGAQKFEVDPSSSFEKITESQSIEEMGMIVKRNNNLMQLRVRTQWVKHFDDFLLGAAFNINEEYEHFGRMLTDIASRTGVPLYGISITSARDADNVVSLGQSGAAGQIDALVSQYADGGTEVKNARPFWTSDTKFRTTQDRDAEIKKMLSNMNDAIIAEDGAMGMWITLFLTTKLAGSALGATLKKLLEWSTIKGVGGKQVLAITAELYEILDRKMKGADPANKTLWDSVKDRLHIEKLVGVNPAELTPKQKELRESQLKGVREVVRESLYSTHSNGLTHEEFMKKMEAGVSERSISGALRAESDIMKKLSPHLPINMDMAVTDRFELEQKFSKMALDMETSTWNNLKRGIWRFFFEKGSLTNLVLQNKAINPSRWTASGSYAPSVVGNADALLGKLDTVELEIHGEKYNLPRAHAEMIKSVIEYVDVELAREAIAKEKALVDNIRTLEERISALKAEGIPETEQGVKEFEDKLIEAQHRYTEFQQLDAAATDARTKKSVADKKLEDAQTNKTGAEAALEKAKSNVVAYNEYGTALQEHNKATHTENEKKGKYDAAKSALVRYMGTLEGVLRSAGIEVGTFSIATDATDFGERTQEHIKSLQDAVVAKNKATTMDVDKIDISSTFGEVNQKMNVVENTSAEYTSVQEDTRAKKVTLDAKIVVLTDLGLGDSAAGRPTFDGRRLSDEVRTKEGALEQAKKSVTDADAEVKKYAAATDKIKRKIVADPLMTKVVNNPTTPGADGNTHRMKTPAELTAQQGKANRMKIALTERTTAQGKIPGVEATRVEALTRAGVKADDVQRLKPRADGTLDTDAQKVLDGIIEKGARLQPQYDAWKSSLPAGWNVEVKDGKATVRDSAGELKGSFDPKNPKEAAKLFEKIGRR